MRKGWLWVVAVLLGLGVLIFAWGRELERRHELLVISAEGNAPAVRPLDLSGKKVVRVLAINGGGVRGIVPLMVLAELERQTGKRTADLFDVFIGTSSGGITVVGSLMAGTDGRPRYSAEEILALFERIGPKLFNPTLSDKVLTLGGVLAPEYSSRKKDAALREEFGTMGFGEVLKPAVLTGFDIDSGKPEAMESWEGPWNRFSAVALMDVTTTFPGVFDPVLLKNGAETLPFYTDMGLVENDPSFAALRIVREAAPDARVVLVNLGTGRYASDPTPYALTHWGGLHWMMSVMPAISSGSVEVTRENLRALAAYVGPERLVYYPIDIALPAGGFYHPFNGSPQNMANVRTLGQKCVAENRATLEEVARVLAGAGE